MKIACKHCSGRIEVDMNMLGLSAPCPHCGVETFLEAPKTPSPPANPTATPVSTAKPTSKAATPRQTAVTDERVEYAPTSGWETFYKFLGALGIVFGALMFFLGNEGEALTGIVLLASGVACGTSAFFIKVANNIMFLLAHILIELRRKQ
jgi:hypothetical protein